ARTRPAPASRRRSARGRRAPPSTRGHAAFASSAPAYVELRILLPASPALQGEKGSAVRTRDAFLSGNEENAMPTTTTAPAVGGALLAHAPVTTLLPVRDLERARRFYAGTLGLTALGARPDGKFVYR